MKNALERYFSADAIKELMHGHNTQTNEGLNTSMLMSAPKYKNLSKSNELAIRVALVAGTHNLGKRKFIEQIIDKLNFTTKPTAFLDLLEYEDESKRKRKCKQATVTVKSQRIQKRVSRALIARRKDIEATKNGTTYGDGVHRTNCRKLNPSMCLYRDYGCDTPGHTHKTLQSSQCKYHYLWKQNQNSKEPRKITKNEWLSKVQAIWRHKHSRDIERGKVTVEDVVLNKFEGDFNVLCSGEGQQTQSYTSADGGDECDTIDHVCPFVTQDDNNNSQLNMSPLDMCDLQFTNSEKNETMSEDHTCDGSGNDSENHSLGTEVDCDYMNEEANDFMSDDDIEHDGP